MGCLAFLMLLPHVYSLQNSDKVCLCSAVTFDLILITVSSWLNVWFALSTQCLPYYFIICRCRYQCFRFVWRPRTGNNPSSIFCLGVGAVPLRGAFLTSKRRGVPCSDGCVQKMAVSVSGAPSEHCAWIAPLGLLGARDKCRHRTRCCRVSCSFFMDDL